MTRLFLLAMGAATVLAIGVLVFAPRPTPSTPPGPATVTLSPGHVPPMAPTITALHAHPERSDWLLATGPHRVSYVTRNRGRAWEPVLLSEPWPRRDLILPDGSAAWSDDGQLVVMRGDERHASSDGGLTFEEQLNPLPLRTGGETVHTESGDWRLTEGTPELQLPGARTWEPRANGLTHPVPAGFLQHPRDPAQVTLVDTMGRLWASSDFGAAWSSVDAPVVQQAVMVEGTEPTWLVRSEEITLSRVTRTEQVRLGPEPAELPRLVVPPYLENPADPRHQRSMLRRMMRHPVIEDAGLRDDGALWVQVGGVDATRTRWIRDLAGKWTSEAPPVTSQVKRAWGGSARAACEIRVRGGDAFVLDTPVDRVRGGGEALVAGFAGDDVLYVVAEQAAQFRAVGEDCTLGAVVDEWVWESPPLRKALAQMHDDELRILGVGEHGLWRQHFALSR